MTNKYLLAGAIAAFIAAAGIAHAPIKNISYRPPIEKSVIAEEVFGKFARENEARGKALMKKFDDLAHFRTDSFYDDTEDVLLARMILGEAESCTKLEKIKIAWTALNRLVLGRGIYGKTLNEVILSPNQYSCFNKEMDSHIFLKDPLRHNEYFASYFQLAQEILNGKYPDPTGGAISYYNPDLVKEKPDWAKKMQKVKEDKGDYHLFYKNGGYTAPYSLQNINL
jgi:hypothetical protein